MLVSAQESDFTALFTVLGANTWPSYFRVSPAERTTMVIEIIWYLLEHAELLKTIEDILKQCRTIWDHSRPLGTIWGNLV